VRVGQRETEDVDERPTPGSRKSDVEADRIAAPRHVAVLVAHLLVHDGDPQVAVVGQDIHHPGERGILDQKIDIVVPGNDPASVPRVAEQRAGLEHGRGTHAPGRLRDSRDQSRHAGAGGWRPDVGECGQRQVGGDHDAGLATNERAAGQAHDSIVKHRTGRLLDPRAVRRARTLATLASAAAFIVPAVAAGVPAACRDC